MTGRFICVVGPSGVGKDSVMRALADAVPQVVLARRVITRPSDAGGEDFDGVTEDRFLQMQDAGLFALSWPAHGLMYGIPTTVSDHLSTGHDVMANLSRAQLLKAQDRFPGAVTVLLTASKDVLAQRLSARGREDAQTITKRLERANYALPDGVIAYEVDNDGPLEQTVQKVRDLLYPVNSKERIS